MGMKILVIDDSAYMLETLGTVLTDNGYEVVKANSGEEGVIAAKSEEPDIVIVDTVMPGIDGFETCRQIKQISGSIAKVIVMTGAIDAVDAGKAREAGADEYGVKTSDFTNILDCIKKLT